MAHAKRKSKAAKSRKPGKKAKQIKPLKKKSAVARAKARPASKARAAAKAAPAAKKKALAAKHAKPQVPAKAHAKADEKAKKPTIKSAKAALEQLEARLAEGLNISEKILTIVDATFNPGYNNFEYVPFLGQIIQPMAVINYEGANGQFVVGEHIFTYHANTSLKGEAHILAVSRRDFFFWITNGINCIW